eukprot:897981_1
MAVEFNFIGYMQRANEECYGGTSKEYDISNEYVYHYTSKSKAKKIIRSESLFPSTNEYNDCLFGVGVYFTSLTPNNSKRDILFNNYGDETNSNEANANAWIRIRIDNLSDVQQINCGRNVWIYPTNHSLDLSEVSAEVSCVKCDFGSRSFECTQCDGNGIFNEGECQSCDGSGTFQHYKKCETCYGNGYGEFICPECDQGMVDVECDFCDGDGYDWSGFCDPCDGDGKTHQECQNCNGNWNRNDCPSCNGTGNFHWNHTEQCNTCSGRGDVESVLVFVNLQCTACNGSGAMDCPACVGGVIPL